MTTTQSASRVAVVTGANRGIGKEVATQLVAAGWTVIVGSRDPERGRRAARLISADHDRVPVVQLDVCDRASVRAAATWVGDHFDHIDALVNNAAIMYDTWARPSSVDLDDVHAAMETNLFGAWVTVQAFLPLMRRSDHGRIVNVSSGAGSISEMSAGTPAYSVSKASLNALTRQLAGELREDRILVNAVCPGWTATDVGGGGGRPIAEGAASVTWAVLLDDDGPTGGFFRDGRPLAW